jgi:hypothetical protein
MGRGQRLQMDLLYLPLVVTKKMYIANSRLIKNVFLDDIWYNY